ncbi:MAG: hypothetical protein IIA50_04960 [Bacteroidetes bacterium]|nr:hypothetical protein [Bacteroidota bacterium]
MTLAGARVLPSATPVGGAGSVAAVRPDEESGVGGVAVADEVQAANPINSTSPIHR